jgi:hypothetical protein
MRHALQLLPDRGTLAVLLRMTWIAAKGRADLLKHCHTAIIVGLMSVQIFICACLQLYR